MRITKLKAGNRIHVSDSELEALRRVTEVGMPLLQGKPNKEKCEDLGHMAKAAIRSPRFNQPGGPLAVIDEDRRSA